jgi:Protein of unknown function (DUF3987)
MTIQVDRDQARLFLKALGKNGNTRMRGFFPSGHPLKATDHGKKAVASSDTALQWQQEGRGVYIVINDGGDTDATITGCRAIFCEWDDRPLDWQITAWQELNLPEPSLMVATGGKSIHCYWIFNDPITVEQWRDLQVRLLEYADADRTLKNPSRVMRLPGAWHLAPDGTPNGKTEIIHTSEHRYTPDQFDLILPSIETVQQQEQASRFTVPTALQPRSLDEIRSALALIPPAVPNQKQYPFYRNLLWALIRACEEVGAGVADAVALMQQHSPLFAEAEQVAASPFTSVGAGTFWFWAQKHGWQPSRHRPAAEPSGAAEGDDLDEDDAYTPAEQFQLAAELAEGRTLFTLHGLLPPDLADAVELLQRPLPTDPLSAVLPLVAGYSGLLKLGTRVETSLGYSKPINLFVASVMRSGGAKTPIKNTLVDNPAKEIRKAAAREHSRAMQAWNDEDRKTRGDAPHPIFPHLSDYTPAALSSQLQLNEQRGLGQLIIRDELSSLFQAVSQDTKNGSGTGEGQLLETFDGEGFASIRVGATPRFYEACHVSIYGNIQPDVLSDLINGNDSTGKFARFLFCRVPSGVLSLPDTDPTDEERRAHAEANQVLTNYANKLYALAPKTYQFTAEARTAFHAWFKTHQLRADLTATPKVLTSLLGKTSAHAMRLAGILHLLKIVHGSVPADARIDTTTVDCAMAVVDQLTRETEAFHEVEDNASTRLMRHINETSLAEGRALKREEIKAKGGRDIRKAITANAFAAAVDELVALGYGTTETERNLNNKTTIRYRALKRIP